MLNIANISARELKKADYAFCSPFTLSLPEKTFVSKKILRLVPRKRLVALGEWEGKTVVAKLFFDRNAQKHLARELRGIKMLHQANIPCPRILYEGHAKDKAISILFLEYLEKAESLETLWEQKRNCAEAEPILEALILELATHHVLGILQKDLHLKNFLRVSGKIYTLDGADIACHGHPLPLKQSLENLALFLSQLGLIHTALEKQLVHLYFKARSLNPKKAELAYLQRTLQHIHRLRWLDYRQKLFRKSSVFATFKKLGHVLFYDRRYDSPAFRALLNDPESGFSHESTEILKAGRSATVAKVSLEGCTFVVKRYNTKHLWHTFKRSFQTSRAKRSWQLAHELEFFGLPTAKPVALIEKRFFNVNGKSYFIMEYVEGTRGDLFFKNQNPNQTLLAAKKTIALLFKLSRLRLSHGDLKITNLTFHDEAEPILLDLDGMHEQKSLRSLKKHFYEDLERFLGNWEKDSPEYKLFQPLIKNT